MFDDGAGSDSDFIKRLCLDYKVVISILREELKKLINYKLFLWDSNITHILS